MADAHTAPTLHKEVLAALSYIHERFGEKITLQMLARQSGLSRSTLLRAFTHIAGCPPGQYITYHRVQKAQELLRGEEGLAEIALRCGFYDQAHFTKAFIRQTGVSPARWREK